MSCVSDGQGCVRESIYTSLDFQVPVFSLPFMCMLKIMVMLVEIACGDQSSIPDTLLVSLWSIFSLGSIIHVLCPIMFSKSATNMT